MTEDEEVRWAEGFLRAGAQLPCPTLDSAAVSRCGEKIIDAKKPAARCHGERGLVKTHENEPIHPEGSSGG